MHALFCTHILPLQGGGGHGYDLSPSFSLIAQSKAPLENYGANIELDYEIIKYSIFLLKMRSVGPQKNHFD